MTRNAFRELFVRALDLAAAQAEARLGSPVPRSFLIELHGPGSSGSRMSVEEAVDRLYLDPDRFYGVIAPAVTQVDPNAAIACVRTSGHPPATFDQTWDPSALGPFKQMLAEHVEDHRVHSG